MPVAAAMVLCTSAGPPLLAHQFNVGKLTIQHPWSRETARGQSAGGGFLKIVNAGRQPDRLIAAASPAAAEVQLHSMTMDGGIMRMRQLKDGIPIASTSTTELKPGGLHIMFIGLKRPFALGARIPATLRFQRAGNVRVEFVVQAIGSTAAVEANHGRH